MFDGVGKDSRFGKDFERHLTDLERILDLEGILKGI